MKRYRRSNNGLHGSISIRIEWVIETKFICLVPGYKIGMNIFNTWQNPQDGSLTSGVELLWYEKPRKKLFISDSKSFQGWALYQEQERTVWQVQAVMESILPLKTFDPENWWAEIYTVDKDALQNLWQAPMQVSYRHQGFCHKDMPSAVGNFLPF